jgi:hypothetical protein
MTAPGRVRWSHSVPSTAVLGWKASSALRRTTPAWRRHPRWRILPAWYRTRREAEMRAVEIAKDGQVLHA